VYSILIASPSDVRDERDAVEDVIDSWNAAHSRATGLLLEPVRWETHARPASGGHPQTLINEQIVDDCDLLVGVFWTRLGTPTDEAASGTLEEIKRMLRAQKTVMLYFSRRPVLLDSVDMGEYRRLADFKREWMAKKGLAWEYESIGDLKFQLVKHLAGAIHNLHEPAPPAETGPTSRQDVLLEEYDSFLRRLRAEWFSEKESEPHSLDDARFIWQRAIERLMDFRTDPSIDSLHRPRALLDSAVKKAKELQRHQLFLDGGKSYQEFWIIGDQLLELLGQFRREYACSNQANITTPPVARN